jgi:hypothetical protein
MKEINAATVRAIVAMVALVLGWLDRLQNPNNTIWMAAYIEREICVAV